MSAAYHKHNNCFPNARLDVLGQLDLSGSLELQASQHQGDLVKLTNPENLINLVNLIALISLVKRLKMRFLFLLYAPLLEGSTLIFGDARAGPAGADAPAGNYSMFCY